jgi:hypothetical protein
VQGEEKGGFDFKRVNVCVSFWFFFLTNNRCQLLAERTYLVSDKGTELSTLVNRYGNVDFSDIDEEDWWFDYDRDVGGEYVEWRPCDAEQVYLNNGEPQEYFEKRMKRLYEHLERLPHDHIVCYTSWGVIREVTGKDEVRNCEICEVSMEELRKRMGGVSKL